MVRETQKFPAIAFSIRPRGGVTECDIDKFQKFSKKYAKEFAIITEKEGDARHIHAIWFLKKPTAPGDFRGKGKVLYNNFWPEWDVRGSVWEKAMCIKPVYSDEWLQNYMDKGDGRVLVESTMKMSLQQRMDHYVDVLPRQEVHPNHCYLKWAEAFKKEYAHIVDPTRDDIEIFFTRHFYVIGDYKIIEDPRKFKTKCYHLLKFIQKTERYPWHNFTTMEEHDRYT